MRIECPTRATTVYIDGFKLDVANGTVQFHVEEPNDAFNENSPAQPVPIPFSQINCTEALSEYNPMPSCNDTEAILDYFKSKAVAILQSYYGG